MKYRFKRSTRRYREGQVVEFSPSSEFTKLRLQRGIIEECHDKPSKKKARSKKVVEPQETKPNAPKETKDDGSNE